MKFGIFITSQILEMSLIIGILSLKMIEELWDLYRYNSIFLGFNSLCALNTL